MLDELAEIDDGVAVSIQACGLNIVGRSQSSAKRMSFGQAKVHHRFSSSASLPAVALTGTLDTLGVAGHELAFFALRSGFWRSFRKTTSA